MDNARWKPGADLRVVKDNDGRVIDVEQRWWAPGGGVEWRRVASLIPAPMPSPGGKGFTFAAPHAADAVKKAVGDIAALKKAFAGDDTLDPGGYAAGAVAGLDVACALLRKAETEAETPKTRVYDTATIRACLREVLSLYEAYTHTEALDALNDVDTRLRDLIGKEA